MRITSVISIILLVVSLVFVTERASALSQPNGSPIPTAPGCNGGKPTGLLATFACACTSPGICNIGTPCASPTSCDDGNHGTCESTMWHAFNDNTCIPTLSSGLDPTTEASLTPETFHPTCALTFSVLSRGTAIFQDVFGWYNVTTGAPPLSDLHPMINCGDAPGASVVLNIKGEPAYKGGDIGFFLISPQTHGAATCASGNCCPTVARVQSGEGYVYYSQREYNPDMSSATPFIHLATFNSHLTTNKFYFAWEDTFQTTSGDFTDLVTGVEGVTCSGAGKACDTGKQGICALGMTTCSDGVVSCGEAVAPTSEACNGVDDDCNGTIDDNATCPVAGDVCKNGQCVHGCLGGEFPCGAGLQCDHATNTCVPSSCVGVTCPQGQLCRSGACAEECSGVVCPHGQVCLGDKCIDLCAGKACATGQSCLDGVCMAGCNACGGMTCETGLSCDQGSGVCADPSCPLPCGAGTFCKSGACVDACAGAICPQGQACVSGECVAEDVDAGGGARLQGGQQDAGLGDNGATFGFGEGKGCGCTLAPTSGGSGAIAFVLGALGLASRRRRRR